MTIKKINSLYEKAENLCQKIIAYYPTAEKNFANKNYFFKNGKWKINYYPNILVSIPTQNLNATNLDINIEPLKDILYIEFFILNQKLTLTILNNLLTNFPKIEIYGGDDCCVSFQDNTTETLLKSIKKSKQTKIGFSIRSNNKNLHEKVTLLLKILQLKG